MVHMWNPKNLYVAFGFANKMQEENVATLKRVARIWPGQLDWLLGSQVLRRNVLWYLSNGCHQPK